MHPWTRRPPGSTPSPHRFVQTPSGRPASGCARHSETGYRWTPLLVKSPNASVHFPCQTILRLHRRHAEHFQKARRHDKHVREVIDARQPTLFDGPQISSSHFLDAFPPSAWIVFHSKLPDRPRDDELDILPPSIEYLHGVKQ